MRQDPDVIMVGEMRDWETMATAITAAETGHLVFSTLHTNNAAQTIDRIMDSCPVTQSNQVRRQLALVLRGICSMQLIERSDGRGLVPAVEVLVNSPKIAKCIETGETKEILEEMETSVSYYRMQSMNQSLIALLVNGATDIEAAMKLTGDPEDLSLKLRKLFPKIEERFRGGIMSPSPNDFAAITELLDVKRLYEEQEEKWKQRVAEKEDLIAQLEADVQERDRQLQSRLQQGAEVEGEAQRIRAEAERARQEMNAKVAQLNERIRELNQRLLAATGGSGGAVPPTTPAGGFFKR
jgi:twitching motility protein PilT